MCRGPFALVVVLLGSSLAAAGEGWPQFRGPRGDGRADDAKVPVTWSATENVVWKTPVHGRAWSSPVVLGDQVWLTTATADGTEMSALCIDRGMGRILHDLKLFENVDPEVGHEFNSFASPTPAIEPGRVYVHFGSYGTACLDTSTAEVLWTRRDLPCNHWRGPGSSPIIFEDLLIIHFDGYDYQYIVALDKATGRTVWKKDREIDYGTDDGDLMKAFSTPSVVEVEGRLQLISPAAKAALAYDPRTGEELWRIRYDEHSSAGRPLFGHGLLFINSGFSRGRLYAVRPDGRGDVTDSHVAWVARESVPSMPSQLLIDGLIYMIHDSGGVATCLDAETGEKVWQSRVGGNYAASPLYAGGRIYFFSREGDATVIAAGREYQRLAVNRLGADPETDGFMASPAVAGNALFLRTKGHLYRIEEQDR